MEPYSLSKIWNFKWWHSEKTYQTFTEKFFYLIFSIFVIAHSHTTSCQAAELALDLEEWYIIYQILIFVKQNLVNSSYWPVGGRTARYINVVVSTLIWVYCCYIEQKCCNFPPPIACMMETSKWSVNPFTKCPR